MCLGLSGVQFHLTSLGSISFFTVNASPVKSGTAAATVVDGLYQEDVAIVPAVEPAVQPEVPKPEEVSTQALSSSTLHSFHFHCMNKHIYCNCGVKYGNMMHVMKANVGNSCHSGR